MPSCRFCGQELLHVGSDDRDNWVCSACREEASSSQLDTSTALRSQEADCRELFDKLFDGDDRRPAVSPDSSSHHEDLAELLRVEAALQPSVWLPWVPRVRGRGVGQLQPHLDCLLWLAKKARLGQDAFLLGPPGCDCRLLALQFCAMAGKDAMYLRLSRDTTESDLKQRREIRSGSVVFTNQPPVDAALSGRVLILEGIEKAERNVLPLLNNLLENREMQLEDGSFLLAPHKRHLLRQDGEQGSGGAQCAKLCPVQPSFFVIAIGLPVPRFRGMPLDPPLRSRFAAFSVEPPSPDEEWWELKEIAPGVPEADLTRLVRAAHRIRRGPVHLADNAPSLPRISEEGLRSVAKLHEVFPRLPLSEALHRAYPHRLLRLDEAKRQALRAALGPELPFSAAEPASPGYCRADLVELIDPGPAYLNDGAFREWEVPPRGVAMLRFEEGTQEGRGREPLRKVAALCGKSAAIAGADAFEGLLTSQKETLIAMLQDHCTNVDICLVGERGVGKTMLTRRFARLLGYQRFTTFCFQDMTARELTARRSTDAAGDTTWQWSPLVEAASRGELAVLDGVHRLPPGSLAATLGRLVSDRELDLPDGTRLVCWDHWQALRLHYSPEELREMKLGLVHPSFRIICTAEPPTAGRSWLDEELLTLLHFVCSPPPTSAEYTDLLASSCRLTLPQKHIRGLHTLACSMRARAEEEPQLYQPIMFSTRRILQVGQYAGSQGDIGQAVAMALGAPVRFLPQSGQTAVRKLLDEATIQGLPKVPVATAGVTTFKPASRAKDDLSDRHLMPLDVSMIALQVGAGTPTFAAAKTTVRRGRDDLRREASAAVQPLQPGDTARSVLDIQVSDDQVCIGSVSGPKAKATRPELVPHDKFVDIPKHVEVLQRLLLDYVLGNHILLIGNQGVGKNKIADRLLALIGKEREYVQLHRDTTIGSLVMTPSLVGGAIVWEDSPLVRAVRHGRVLMIDEADKAPLEVVCILKSLVEDQELALPDGRRIAQRTGSPHEGTEDDKVIWVHEGFRMIVLANRPGFPFLGNDFYRECGDVFASTVVDNPDMRSEAELLSAYGPTVPKEQIAEVLALFATLRELVEQGKINYPYSAREAVKIVEHLERFPEDPLQLACRDVFSFDDHAPATQRTLAEALQQHGLQPAARGAGATEAAILAAAEQRTAAAVPAAAGRRRGISPARPGRLLPVAAQAEDWGLRMSKGQSKGIFPVSTAEPIAATSGFGVALAGPTKCETGDTSFLPPELLEISDKSEFQRELHSVVRTAMDFTN